MVNAFINLEALENLSAKEVERLREVAENYLVEVETFTGMKIWESTFPGCGSYGHKKSVTDNTIASLIEHKRQRVLDKVQEANSSFVSFHFPRRYSQYFSDDEIAELEQTGHVVVDPDGVINVYSYSRR